MVGGGIPSELTDKETASYALMKARKQALKQLSVFADRKTISDFDTNVPLNPLEQDKLEKEAASGLILPKEKKKIV
ncbi:hypothetical protein UFOVP457_40 [uncultured Caudovirales phage]|jgi:hypothetical protein|uniref:Uncharacterized protein n=1 Tax=uncultured Caudovirales phage TaxID=2100421 RepID=A0A6J5MGB6_9CAUD|nr:hypothetical protein UFOVP457_40 [uncultured Caudovirales phage]